LRVLVTGATGYIGGRLVPKLLEAGHDVHVLVRDARRFKCPGTDEGRLTVIEGDLVRNETLAGKLSGFDAAYYLVHSMLQRGDFREQDKQAASNFGEAAADCKHVIYLGGLLPGDAASKHLRSRAETGEVLERHFPGKVTEFRAGPIIGSGSASFEMVRYLTERLPVMITPRWVNTEVSPIAARDVLAYLVAALDKPPAGTVEIGGDKLQFRDMMQGYARVRGLPPRVLLTTPFLAPKLAARWVGFVTPISNRLAVPLVEGMTQPLLADTAKARELYPEIEPMNYEQGLQKTMNTVMEAKVTTRWSDALGAHRHFELTDERGLIREVRRIKVDAGERRVFDAFTSIGGDKGWLVWNFLWTIRGWIDSLIGGPGLRRGRRHPQELAVGEAVDFWRVERIEKPTLLRLRAEMLLPGKAWLQWETEPIDDGAATLLTQTALFEPKGLTGFLYWYSLYPIHLFIFSDLVRAIGRDATR